MSEAWPWDSDWFGYDLADDSALNPDTASAASSVIRGMMAKPVQPGQITEPIGRVSDSESPSVSIPGHSVTEKDLKQRDTRIASLKRQLGEVYKAVDSAK